MPKHNCPQTHEPRSYKDDSGTIACKQAEPVEYHKHGEQ
jgi:hypothetical protein